MQNVTRFAAILLVVTFCALGFASKRASPRTYVQSGPGGVFYARCTPTTREGSHGRTEIYRVRDAGDELVDRYDWYATAVYLGWSPIKGKVSVLAVFREERQENWKEQEVMRFAIGGKLLKSYSAGDLLAMGAREAISSDTSMLVETRVIGCEQVFGTNEYDYVIELGKDKRLRFDITTGEIRPPATQPSP